jgi:hypothetical protein
VSHDAGDSGLLGPRGEIAGGMLKRFRCLASVERSDRTAEVRVLSQLDREARKIASGACV